MYIYIEYTSFAVNLYSKMGLGERIMSPQRKINFNVYWGAMFSNAECNLLIKIQLQYIHIYIYIYIYIFKHTYKIHANSVVHKGRATVLSD